jgi:class 3 adenylate cyclase
MEAADPTSRGPVSGMHAFLFADLRGYTQFAATRGDRAAAELLDRYRTLVRDQVAQHAGAEVRTEGDSFYILFASVSEAVHCALAIAAAAREASSEDPALPLNVGIGVHFGETVDTAEGSVGSAVNLAARLASAAGPNEVLVSEVVRSLTRTSSDLRTTSGGRRRLKGFTEPVEVFRASTTEGPGAPSARKRRAPVWALVATGLSAAALFVIGLAVALNRGGVGPSPSATPALGSATPAPTPMPFNLAYLKAGQYAERRFVPNLSLDLDEGWCGGFFSLTIDPGPDTFYMYWPGTATGGQFEDTGEACAADQRAADAGFVDFHRVEQVYGQTACDDGLTSSVGGSWNALVDYLTSLPGTTVTGRTSASLGGVVGVAFDLHVDHAEPCLQSGAPLPAVLAFPMTVVERGSQRTRVAPRWWGEGQYLHVWILKVDSQLVVVSLGHDGSTSQPNSAFTRKAYPVLQSVRFLPPT